MLTEEFRPKTFDDVVGHNEHVRILKSYCSSHGLVRLLLYGPPGTGKTSTAIVTINELIKLGNFDNDCVLFRNASDDRTMLGISDVREFISLRGRGIIFLDECDNLTQDAQDSLRRIMDSKQADLFHFILCVNDISGIAAEIKDRLVTLRFSKIDISSHVSFLKRVATRLDKTAPDDVFMDIIKETDGDIRQSINELLACCILSTVRSTPLMSRHKSTLNSLLCSFWSKSIEERRNHILLAEASGYTCPDIVSALWKLVCCEPASKKDVELICMSMAAINAGCVDRIHMLRLCY